MIKVVIIDDEPKAILGLQWELEAFKKDVEIVATFTEPEKALSFLNNTKVDCLFLDVEMPTMDGFQFLEKVKNRNFVVIITTAYNDYAIEALKKEALDYLLKPIDSDDLKEALKKVKKHKIKDDSSELFEKILLEFNNKYNSKKITINTDGKLVFLNPSDIYHVASDGNYCTLFLSDNKKLVITKKLKDFNDLLPDYQFFRIHNSYVINLSKVKEYIKSDGYVVLENNVKIPVSRQRKSKFLEKF